MSDLPIGVEGKINSPLQRMWSFSLWMQWMREGRMTWVILSLKSNKALAISNRQLYEHISNSKVICHWIKYIYRFIYLFMYLRPTVPLVQELIKALSSDEVSCRTFSDEVWKIIVLIGNDISLKSRYTEKRNRASVPIQHLQVDLQQLCLFVTQWYCTKVRYRKICQGTRENRTCGAAVHQMKLNKTN